MLFSDFCCNDKHLFVMMRSQNKLVIKKLKKGQSIAGSLKGRVFGVLELWSNELMAPPCSFFSILHHSIAGTGRSSQGFQATYHFLFTGHNSD
jgi:hypothetical protein